ncbi:MAG TPA: hypothetical protein VNK82_01255 [Terriglobales bacterium]|nr:hypothetical protein [Terriglobales bacterium]
MTEKELHEARRARWRLDGRPVRTADDAAGFVESVGMCALHPQPELLLPSFVGAWVGGDERLPTAQRAFEDERAHAARELAVELLRRRAAFESNLLGENVLLVAGSVFPFFYALKGDKNPRAELKPGRRERISPLAADVFGAIQKGGPMSKRRLREALGGEPSEAALDRALGELWARLRIMRVDYRAGEGALWDTLLRWAPEAVKEGLQLSVGEALSALISRYLEAVVAAERSEIEKFFSYFAPRSRVRENINALLGARELAFHSVGAKTLLELAPVREAGRRTVAAQKP